MHRLPVRDRQLESHHMLKPLVSITVPCFNHDQYVQECIQSIIEQDYKNIELIVIDDGSNDQSIDKIQEMIPLCKKRFVRFEFKSRPNKGLCATLNEAIEWSNGVFFSAIASDDAMLIGKTSKQVDYMVSTPKCMAVFGGVDVINNNGETLHKRQIRHQSFDFKQIILMNYFLPAPTQMIRLSHIRKAGGYPLGFIIEDWYMWLKLSSYGSLDCMHEIVAKYRKHGDNLSKKTELMASGRKQIIEEYKDSILYDKAQAISRIETAVELLPSSRMQSLTLFVKVLSRRPSIIFCRRTLIFLYKFFMLKSSLQKYI